MTDSNVNTQKPSNLPDLTSEILSTYPELVSEFQELPDIQSLEHCLRAIASLGISALEDRLIEHQEH